jgi:hypothetical protein
MVKKIEYLTLFKRSRRRDCHCVTRDWHHCSLAFYGKWCHVFQLPSHTGAPWRSKLSRVVLVIKPSSSYTGVNLNLRQHYLPPFAVPINPAGTVRDWVTSHGALLRVLRPVYCTKFNKFYIFEQAGFKRIWLCKNQNFSIKDEQDMNFLRRSVKFSGKP